MIPLEDIGILVNIIQVAIINSQSVCVYCQRTDESGSSKRNLTQPSWPYPPCGVAAYESDLRAVSNGRLSSSE